MEHRGESEHTICAEVSGIADYIQDEINGIAARETYEKNFTLDIFGNNLREALIETEQEWERQV